MMMTQHRWRVLLAAVAVLGLTTACGDDDDAAPATSGDPAPVVDETDGEADPAGGIRPADGEELPEADLADANPVDVAAVDFAFEGLPDTIAAGSTIQLTNESPVELHELVAVRLPDDEDRSVDELVQLPQDELMGLFAGVTDVVAAMPGADGMAVEGDGVLDQPGRYAMVCFIPTGVDPQVYLDAAAASPGGPPQIEGAGPPHIVHGMFAEVVVE